MILDGVGGDAQSLIRFDNILGTRGLLDQFRPALCTASFPDVRYTN